MIVQMKKISLVILGNEKKQALKHLRKLGMMHIEISEGAGGKIDELRGQISLLEASLFTLGKKPKNSDSRALSTKEAIEAAHKITELRDSIKADTEALLAYRSELERIKPFGEIKLRELEELSKCDIRLSLYEMPAREYERLDDSLKTLSLRKSKNVLFVTIGDTDDYSNLLNPYRVRLPELSTDELVAKESKLEAAIEKSKAELASYSDIYASLKAAILDVNKQLEFEIYSSGMESKSLSETSDVSVAYFRGYVEADNLELIKEAARTNSWGLLIEEPTEEDNVPTKLKNNKFVSLIYPLTDFLGTVPGYFEYDISAWFLGFILIFFGIIFGDGGYGLLISLCAAIPIVKALISKKKIAPVFLLIGLFGLSTVLWGMLTCTWFGLAPSQLPQWLQNLSIPFISNVYADKIWQPFWTVGEVGLTTAQNLQIFCFSLALIQLSVAHIKVALRNRRSIKILGDVGSILQLLGIYYFVLSLVVNPEVFPLGLVIGGVPIGLSAIILVGIGFVMSFVFSNYEGSIIKSILTSLTNIVSVLLGVVNVFSDIVSYIRLWAVGLAGAAISATVNQLAGPLLGNFLFMIVAIFLLVFGHGLNMILNVLSVIVHGIRLNTLEFSSHLDMSWSGHKFKPFEE